MIKPHTIVVMIAGILFVSIQNQIKLYVNASQSVSKTSQLTMVVQEIYMLVSRAKLKQ